LPLLPGGKGTAEVNIDSDSEIRGRVSVDLPITGIPLKIGGSIDLPDRNGKISVTWTPSEIISIDGGIIFPSDEKGGKPVFEIKIKGEF